MPIRDDLKKSLVESAKARDQVRLDTIRGIQSAIRYKEIDKRGELTDTEILSVIQTLSKQRRESIEQYTNGGRTDLADKEAVELKILEAFLPAQLSRADIEKVAKTVIEELGAKGPADMGRVMKEAVKRLVGQADGKIVSEVVKALLG